MLRAGDDGAILLRVPTLAFERAVPGCESVVGKWVSAAAVNFEETLRLFFAGR